MLRQQAVCAPQMRITLLIHISKSSLLQQFPKLWCRVPPGEPAPAHRTRDAYVQMLDRPTAQGDSPHHYVKPNSSSQSMVRHRGIEPRTAEANLCVLSL